MLNVQQIELFLSSASFQSAVGVLCLLYFCLSAHAILTLARFRIPSPMTPSYQLVLCVATASLLRLACFATFFGISANARGPSARSSPPSREETFYAESVVLLFDVPDFIVVSTYALLIVVWFEEMLEARTHWMNARSYKRRWRVAYLAFNVSLYLAQSALYGVVFCDSARVDGVRLLYGVLAALTLGIPVAHGVLYVALSFRLAGFPPADRGAERRGARRHLARVALAWGFGRSLWGGAVAAAVFRTSAVEGLRLKPRSGPLMLVALFLVTEICPFLLALDSGFLELLSRRPTTPKSPRGYASIGEGRQRRSRPKLPSEETETGE